MTSTAVVLISGGGSNLQAFIDHIETRRLDLSISLVISNVDNVYGLERAKTAGIDTEVVRHQDFGSRLEFDNRLIDSIDAHAPDVIIMAGGSVVLHSETGSSNILSELGSVSIFCLDSSNACLQQPTPWWQRLERHTHLD